ncbi:MAG TPA: hypothetical protein VHF51_14940 [Solirubrobacteraceae bacterium]|nr:hypothetical protein [Solirubrobacteraceae bacterium]
MPGRGVVIAIGLVIAAPLIFAAFGASQRAGLIVGVVLVVVGIGWMLAGARRRDAPDEERDRSP